MSLRTGREKIVVNGSLEELKRSIERAKELMEKCAEAGGQAYVEKTGSDTIDVKCIYKGEEEPVKIELEDVEQTMLDKMTLSLPPQMSPEVLDDAKKRLNSFAGFVEACIAKGGEVRLVKDRVGEPAVEVVNAECWKVVPKEETKAGEEVQERESGD